MKSLIYILALITSLFAQDIKVTQSWQLLGTSEKIDNINVFNKNCLKSIWSYKDGSWYQFRPKSQVSNLLSLDKEQGFWIIGKESCNLSTNDVIDSNIDNSSLEFVALTSWDEVAVRKILHLFAYGSFAKDSQIATWAEMNPTLAIDEMLTLSHTNQKISPSQSSDKLHKNRNMLALSEFWSGDSSLNQTPADDKKYFIKTNWSSPSFLWTSSVNRRGLNPFREKIGLFETNYHLVANRSVGVYPQVLINYYDSILDGLAKNLPYDEVLASASSSAAIAYQYGHNRNKFENGKFRGNEDFAREFHQLFFGILGEDDSDYHEFYSIRNTAKALTGIVASWHSEENGGPDVEASYDSSIHYPSSLEILKTDINGSNAKEKMFNLSKVGIEHKESLDNLPIMIIRNLADDNLNEQKIAKLRYNWAKMESKNLLEFLKKYATSQMFHSSDRFKFYSSIDRNMLILNKMTLTNEESYLKYYNPYWILGSEDVTPFEPIHDVFGHQSSLEASDSPSVFQVAYNRATKDVWYFVQSYRSDSDDKDKIIWEKDWSKTVPKSESGDYVVSDVASWLWNYMIADGGKNFGSLEKAHIYSLLASGTDLAFFLDEENPLRIYSLDELENDRLIADKISDAGVARLELKSSDIDTKRDANTRIGKAIAFISATPYMFLQEGK